MEQSTKLALQLLMMFGDLTRLRVDDSKNNGVKLAETVATGVTTIFSIFGTFSIMVGMLLIFLVFVLLAAARSTELGMARAVGLKRRDLIQLFTYEGTVYSFLAAIAGTLIGIGSFVSAGFLILFVGVTLGIDESSIYGVGLFHVICAIPLYLYGRKIEQHTPLEAFLTFFSILKGFKVLIPIFLKGSQFNSSS